MFGIKLGTLIKVSKITKLFCLSLSVLLLIWYLDLYMTYGAAEGQFCGFSNIYCLLSL